MSAPVSLFPARLIRQPRADRDPVAAPVSSSVVLRLSLPQGNGSARHSEEHPPPDLPGLVGAVRDLVRSLAPGVLAEIELPLPEQLPAGSRADSAAQDETFSPHPGLEIDPGARTITVDGNRVVTTRKEFELLILLSGRLGKAVGRREIMGRVWGSHYTGSSRTLDVHVRRLRVKLGPYGARLETIRGFGYRYH